MTDAHSVRLPGEVAVDLEVRDRDVERHVVRADGRARGGRAHRELGAGLRAHHAPALLRRVARFRRYRRLLAVARPAAAGDRDERAEDPDSGTKWLQHAKTSSIGEPAKRMSRLPPRLARRRTGIRPRGGANGSSDARRGLSSG